MQCTPQQVINALQQEQYAPVYCLHGNEPYYIDLIIHYMTKKVLRPVERDFNLTTLYGSEHSLRAILTQARRFPMGSTRQVVIVKEAQQQQDLRSTLGQQQLQAYLQSPQPTTVLTFVYRHGQLETKSKLYKLFSKYATVVDAKQVPEHRLEAWLRTYVKEQGHTITDQAIALLKLCLGNNLQILVNAIDKVDLNLLQPTTIDEAMVYTYVGISRTFNVFELQRALARKNEAKAYQIVQHLVNSPKHAPAIPLVMTLFTFFSKLLLYHQAKDESPSSLASILQVNPYFVHEYIRAGQHYTLSKVMANLGHLYSADLQLKGVDYPQLSEGAILKALVFQLLQDE